MGSTFRSDSSKDKIITIAPLGPKLTGPTYVKLPTVHCCEQSTSER